MVLRTIRRLTKHVWKESGALARIGYGVGILLPASLARPWAQDIQHLLRIDWVLKEVIGEPTIIEIPGAWAAGMSLGAMALWTIWGLAKATFRYESELAPKISIFFDAARGGIAFSPDKYKDPEMKGPVAERQSVSIRIGVRSGSKKTAKDCLSYLVDVKKMAANGTFSDTAFLDSVPLQWSGPVSEYSIAIPHYVTRYITVLKAYDHQNKLQIASSFPIILRDLFDDITTYRLTVSVIGEDISESIMIDVHWNGVWDQIRASEISSSPIH